jgi:catechol 2,3-dioxygenase-like lactoylglutathione lyase family enzyme
MPSAIGAITLFVEDLPTSKAFYRNAFGGSVVYEDDVSAVFGFGPTLVNLPSGRAAGCRSRIG